MSDALPRQLPYLDRKLARPITLRREPSHTLRTLYDAAVLIAGLELFSPARPVWDRAAEMVQLAATTGKTEDIQEATRQMLVALEHENWWKPNGRGMKAPPAGVKNGT